MQYFFCWSLKMISNPDHQLVDKPDLSFIIHTQNSAIFEIWEVMKNKILYSYFLSKKNVKMIVRLKILIIIIFFIANFQQLHFLLWSRVKTCLTHTYTFIPMTKMLKQLKLNEWVNEISQNSGEQLTVVECQWPVFWLFGVGIPKLPNHIFLCGYPL